jgi:imidazole glycerol-phosphate synthase subunit HisH
MFDIAIINYGMGNLHSVYCACEKVGLKAKITDKIEEINESKAIILPGVGAFGSAMKKIKEKKIDKAIYAHHKKQKKIIGICLGMQLLFEKSYEITNNKGLDILKGDVMNISGTNKNLLNVGWRDVKINEEVNSLLNSMTKKKNQYYFIHSFYVELKEKQILTASSEFIDKKFCCAIKKNNIEAFQFHPEKSGDAGLEIFNNLKKEISI